MSVIAISSAMGTGGAEIGTSIAHRLGFQYVAHSLMTAAACQYGLREDRIDSVCEARPSLLARLAIDTRRYLAVTQAVLYTFATVDDVVLMGHGGQWLLRDVPHALRIQLTAPVEARVARLLSENPGAQNVARAVRADDASRAARMRYFYGVRLDNPLLYDVTLDADRLSDETIVDLICDLARSAAFATTEGGRQRVADLALAARVDVALASDPSTRRWNFGVTARDGAVTIQAGAGWRHAVDVAQAVRGVTAVEVREAEEAEVAPLLM